MMNGAVMNPPVIWYFLRQAKVSHHRRAHAALPAHEAVLHRGVRGHTHITITDVKRACEQVYCAELLIC